MTLTIITGIFVFIFGTLIGSFLSVVIHRIHVREKGIFWGRSRCPHCKTHLKPHDLIPMFSYLFSKGKCRYCKKPLTPHYFFLEFLTGLVFLLIFFKFPFILEEQTLRQISFHWYVFLNFTFLAICGTFLIGIFFYDLQHLEIPDVFLFPFMILTLIGSLFLKGDILNLLIAFVISLVFFGGQIALSKGKWLGDGDLYLGIGMAFLFGWQKLLLAIVLTYIIGAFLSIPLLISQKADRKTKIPFAPFMVIGTFATLFWGDYLLNWYLNSLNLSI